MPRKDLIQGNKVDTSIALEIYAEADSIAKKAAMQRAKKPGKNSVEMYGTEEVSPILETLLTPIIMQYNLLNPEEYSRLENAINDWDLYKEDIDPDVIYKGANLQSALVPLLPECKKAQEDEHNLQQQQKRIDQYRVALLKYQEYLENQIEKSILAMNERELADLHQKLQLIAPDISLKRNADIKSELTNYLLIDYKKSETLIDASLSSKPNLIFALKKLDVLKQAGEYLKPSKRFSAHQSEHEFLQHLRNNKDILTQRRDNGFNTFLKGLGVAAVTLLSLGIGTYFICQRLFGAKATHGNTLLNKVSTIQKRNA